MTIRYDNRVAIVTGAGAGLGRQHALLLASRGAKVVVNDPGGSVDGTGGESAVADQVVAEIKAAGGQAIAAYGSVSDEVATGGTIDLAMKTWGRVDILVCNAGGGRGRPVDTKASELTSDLLHLVTSMNLYGTVYCVNAVAPIMKAQRSGKIVTVSSVAGLGPSPDGGYAHYGAAKAAIAHYTKYLAQDLGPYGVTANCIAPGTIGTGRILATVIPGSAGANQDRSARIALRRIGTVEDCAKVVEFLTTDLSDYVSGVVIPIDGGLVRSN